MTRPHFQTHIKKSTIDIMTFSLSSRAIINSIHALSAADTRLECDTPAPRLLSPDSTPMLKILIKNEFSSLAASLFPLVSDCNVDNETAGSDYADNSGDWLTTMDVPSADTMPLGMAGATRRGMETLLALRCIIAAYTLDGIDATSFSEKATSMIRTLRSALDQPSAGCYNITPWAV